jgi:hypothetical protein
MIQMILTRNDSGEQEGGIGSTSGVPLLPMPALDVRPFLYIIKVSGRPR